MSRERLDKILAGAGAGSRSDVKKLIRAGRVTVNGEKALRPEIKADPAVDEILADGRRIAPEGERWFMLHKPAGVVSAVRDAKEKTVLDLIAPGDRRGLFPVGRLDKDTTGLLLLTDDGALAHRLLSPRRHVDKIYLVRCREEIPPETAGRFLEGLDIGDEKKTLPAVLEDIQGNTCRVTLREGRYHQVKRMFAAVGNEVTGLHRLAMGGLFLDEDLKPGTARRLTPEELAQLRGAAGPRDDADGPEEAAEFETEESTEADVEE